MIAPRVLTEAEMEAALIDRGFRPTASKTATGTYWAHPSGKHIQVPNSLEGFYPDWMLYELVSRIEEIVPVSAAHPSSDFGATFATKH